MIIVDLKHIAEAEGGITVTDCCISVPTYYTEAERYAMLNAAQVGTCVSSRGVVWCLSEVNTPPTRRRSAMPCSTRRRWACAWAVWWSHWQWRHMLVVCTPAGQAEAVRYAVLNAAQMRMCRSGMHTGSGVLGFESRAANQLVARRRSLHHADGFAGVPRVSLGVELNERPRIMVGWVSVDQQWVASWVRHHDRPDRGGGGGARWLLGKAHVVSKKGVTRGQGAIYSPADGHS